MKTTFLKIAIVLLMITAGNKTFATTPNKHQDWAELTWINNFYKVEVHGNVQVHLLSGEKNRVQMSGTYYDHNALVQVDNGVLRISCYRTERLDVWITVYDLSALAAYDNVLVKTEGSFSALDLDIDLFNNAKANVDLDCCFTHIKLNDSSVADISGTALESELDCNYAATLNSTNFSADQLSMKREMPVKQKYAEYAAIDNSDYLFDAIKGINDQRFTIILNGTQLTAVNAH